MTNPEAHLATDNIADSDLHPYTDSRFSILPHQTQPNEWRQTGLERIGRPRAGCSTIVIPSFLTVLDRPTLGEYCRNRKQLADMIFEGNSQLTQISDFCFSGCSLHSICIPRSVEVLGFRCFSDANIDSLTFEPGSRLTSICDWCFTGCRLKPIVIPRSVAILGSCCFARLSVPALAFESESKVMQISERCFEYCFSLKSICIPRYVEVVRESAFATSGIESVSIEMDSHLRKLEGNCFAYCRLKCIDIPAGFSEIELSLEEERDCQLRGHCQTVKEKLA
jgi:hypothetical protein